MAKTREERAEARARRRAKSAPDFDEVVDHDGAPSPADALRTAASAAIAGAAVGAAQAFARRRHHEEDDEAEPEPEPTPDEPESQSEPGSEVSQPADEEAHEEEGPEKEQPQPIASGEAPEMVERARRQLRELRGTDAETVSSIRRTSDGWRVGLEVVELQRIPESTDVLATFEVTLDGDGNLLTFERTRRYYRSEAERG